MKNSTVIIAVAVALFVGAVGGYLFSNDSVQVASVSATGTTNTSAKIFSKVMSLTSASATTTSIAIPADYAIKSSFAFCNTVGTSKTAYSGSGLANLLIVGATTSSAITGNLADSNTNYGTQLTIGTSTVYSYASSTAETTPNGTGRYLPSGSYYTFSANATNTASCTVGVEVIAI